ncbi:MAG: FAD-dependent oxidoreductase [Tissierellia bacterium]|nr:FAD-dependent oxidoreductase [Tissierellia bacterium]
MTEELVDADSLDADLIVVCIGVRPNLNFVNRDQIEIDRGILIDDHMRTSNPDVYAAGDVSQGMNLLTGKREIIGLLANARYQVRTAQGGVFRQVQSLFYRY